MRSSALRRRRRDAEEVAVALDLEAAIRLLDRDDRVREARELLVQYAGHDQLEDGFAFRRARAGGRAAGRAFGDLAGAIVARLEFRLQGGLRGGVECAG